MNGKAKGVGRIFHQRCRAGWKNGSARFPPQMCAALHRRPKPAKP
jgi:hypothetical protein